MQLIQNLLNKPLNHSNEIEIRIASIIRTLPEQQQIAFIRGFNEAVYLLNELLPKITFINEDEKE